MTKFPFAGYRAAIENEAAAKGRGVEIRILDAEREEGGCGTMTLKYVCRGKAIGEECEGGKVVQTDAQGCTVFTAEIGHVDAEAGLITVRTRGGENPYRDLQTWVTEPDYLAGLLRFAGRLLERSVKEPWCMDRFTGLREELLAPVEGLAAELRPECARHLREDQAVAVQNALERRASFVWGPPGTGKSYTLGHVAAEFAAKGLRVLAVSHTKAATDVGTLAIDDAFARTGTPAKAGEIIRCAEDFSKCGEFSDRKHLAEFSEVLKEYAKKIEEAERAAKKAQAAYEHAKRKNKGEGEAFRKYVVAAAERVKMLREARKAELERLVDSAKVVCVSVTSCIFSGYAERNFDVLLVDEASQIPLAAWPCLLSGKKWMRVVVAGDPMQLPPVDPKNCGEGERFWFANSIYTYLGMAGMAGIMPFLDSGAMAVQRTQSRMRKGICEAVSAAFYNGLLKGDREGARLEWPEDSGLPNGERVVVDAERSAPAHGMGVVSPRAERNTNSASANVVLAMLERMEKHAPAGRKIKALVLTPYRNQAMIYKRALAGRRRGLRLDVEAGTVHCSQGSEADVVILDVVDPASYFVRKAEAAHMWCVACSRAREQLIAVGDAAGILREGFTRRIFDGAQVAAIGA